MGYRIILRSSRTFSPFRRSLLSLCGEPGAGGLYLCSGYFTDSPQYSISGDHLASAVSQGCGSSSPVVVIGSKMPNGSSNPHVVAFVNGLRSAGVQVSYRRVTANRWHAKVAVRLDNQGLACAAIIGSSNLTGPAFGENRHSWNREADVIMWVDGHPISKKLTEIEFDDELDYADLRLADDRAPREPARLKSLLTELDASSFATNI